MLSFFTIDKYPGAENIPIIIWGAGQTGKNLISMYEIQYMEYNVVAFVDNDITKQGMRNYPVAKKNIVRNNAFCNKKIPVISPKEMREYCMKHEECIIVVATPDKYKDEIYCQVSSMRLKNTIVDGNEFTYLIIREYIDCHIKKYDIELAYQYYTFYYDFVNHVYVDKFRPVIGAIDKDIPFVTIVSPPKTGGNTVDDALTKACIPHLYYHNGYNLNENPEQPKKWVPIIREKCNEFVIGVREPVSQNISLMFNQMPNFFSLRNNINNFDAQQLFDHYVAAPVLGSVAGDSIYEWELMKSGTNFIRELYIQHYFEGSIKATLGIDVYQINFDKEAGYTIAEQNGKRIFIYQIEKMNSIRKELSDFLQIEPVYLGHSNDGLKKYYSNPYKNFIKDFKMTKEYFDYSYSCNYVRQFYSDKAISEYMTKWKDHVA